MAELPSWEEIVALARERKRLFDEPHAEAEAYANGTRSLTIVTGDIEDPDEQRDFDDVRGLAEDLAGGMGRRRVRGTNDTYQLFVDPPTGPGQADAAAILDHVEAAAWAVARRWWRINRD